MKARTFFGVIFALLVAPCWGSDANDVTGLSVWALGSDGRQELRVGWRGLLPSLEFAAGGVHFDAPDDGVEEWEVRGYAMAHLLDADLAAQLLGTERKLPDGNLYGGLFAAYGYDRADEWSGGYVLGGQVEVRPTWYAVTEYEGVVLNATNDDWKFVAGLCHVF